MDLNKIKETCKKYGYKMTLSFSIEDDIEEIYYLAHPLTTHGDIDENYKSEKKCAKWLKKQGYKHLVRPLKIIPKSYSTEDSMRICMQLLSACDGIILCDGWKESQGCLMEFEQASSNFQKMKSLVNTRKTDTQFVNKSSILMEEKYILEDL